MIVCFMCAACVRLYHGTSPCHRRLGSLTRRVYFFFLLYVVGGCCCCTPLVRWFIADCVQSIVRWEAKKASRTSIFSHFISWLNRCHRETFYFSVSAAQCQFIALLCVCVCGHRNRLYFFVLAIFVSLFRWCLSPLYYVCVLRTCRHGLNYNCGQGMRNDWWWWWMLLMNNWQET